MSGLRWLLRAARPEGWRLAAAAMLGTATLGCAIGLLATSAWLISRAAQQPPILYLAVAIVAVRAFGLGRGVLRYCERLIGHDAAFRIACRARVGVYTGLERAAPAGLAGQRSGDLLARVVSDVEAVQDVLIRALLPLAVAVLTAAGAVTLLAAILPAAGLVLLAGLLVAGLAAPLAGLAAARRAERRLAPARGALTASVVEVLHGAADLTAYRAADRWLDAVAGRDSALTGIARRTAAGAGIGAALTSAALGGTVLAELLLAVPAAGSGRIPPVMLAVLVLTPLAAFELAAPLPGAFAQLARGLPALDRLHELAVLPAPGVEGGTRTLPPGPAPLAADRLTVRWPGAAEPTLRDVSLTLKPGRRVALIGASGAGKSTLVAALLGFLRPERGTVRLGGVDLADLDPAVLRRTVAVCAQDAHVFDSTLRNNLLIARPDATDAELHGALRQARLADWAGAQPRGLDTMVGERGAQLSGGERQRLALARAVLSGAPVLLLDEPTAHLDEPTAAALTRDLQAATSGRTVLLVTHRRSELAGFDEVLDLTGGSGGTRGSRGSATPPALATPAGRNQPEAGGDTAW
jgi:ATP-binding cassette, subfamily C, bacterial CydC